MKKYPRGKLSADDEGQTSIMVYVQDKTVIVRFQEPVSWIGMAGEEALAVAEALIQRARECGCTKPITITV